MSDAPLLETFYDPALVILSMVVATLASFVALDVAARIWHYAGWRRQCWIVAAATAMGGGIWSMHFIAMLAFSLPVDIAYDLPMTLASLAIAILVTAIAFGIVTGDRHWQRLLAAGAFMGLGVGAMHYTGMAAMRMPALTTYDPAIFALSLVIAVVAATAALWIATRVASLGWRLVAALVMGAAVSGMHYTGMAAACFAAAPLLNPSMVQFERGSLALIIAVGSLVILTLEFASAVVDRRFAERVRTAQELRTANEKLTEAMSRLAEQERLAVLGRLAGIVSHELRNPLAAIQLSVTMIRQDAADRDHVERAVERAERGVQRCTAIIFDLLEFVQPAELACQPTEIDGWLRQEVQGFAKDCPVAIRRELHAGAEVAIDHASFGRALRNILQNAVQALTDPAWKPPVGRPREIVVRTAMSGRRLRLTVADTGPGIPAEQLPLIFEPLFTTKSFGVGLGLPLLHQIVARHGGTVAVESAPEIGTAFVIELPRAAAAIAHAA